jgi:hypothetical protein
MNRLSYRIERLEARQPTGPRTFGQVIVWPEEDAEEVIARTYGDARPDVVIIRAIVRPEPRL